MKVLRHILTCRIIQEVKRVCILLIQVSNRPSLVTDFVVLSGLLGYATKHLSISPELILRRKSTKCRRWIHAKPILLMLLILSLCVVPHHLLIIFLLLAWGLRHGWGFLHPTSALFTFFRSGSTLIGLCNGVVISLVSWLLSCILLLRWQLSWGDDTCRGISNLWGTSLEMLLCQLLEKGLSWLMRDCWRLLRDVSYLRLSKKQRIDRILLKRERKLSLFKVVRLSLAHKIRLSFLGKGWHNTLRLRDAKVCVLLIHRTLIESKLW